MVEISVISNEDLGAVVGRMQLTPANICVGNWSPILFRPKGRRLISDFESTNIMVFDVDGGCTLEEAKLSFAPFKHIIGLSKSHQKQKNGVVDDRFRVVLFLHRPITDIREYYYNWELLYKEFPFIDRQCKDPARFYYPCTEIVSENEGDLVGVQQAPDEPTINKIESTYKTKKGQLTNRALEFLALGAPAGHWHGEFIYTASCLKEQGYSEAEAQELLEKITGHLDSTDVYQLSDVYKRESKYEYQPKKEHEPLFIKASDLCSDTMSYLVDKDKVYGEPTGFDPLDKLLGGGRRLGEITALMAEAKTGKNTLLHWLLPKSLNKGVAWGYASRELSPAEEVIPNLLTVQTGINYWKAEVDDDLKLKSEAVLVNWELYFAPGYGVFPIDKIEEWFRAMAREGVKYFIFDHFHHALMREDYESTSVLAKTLKRLVKELNIYLEIIIQPRGLHQNERLSLATLRGGKVIGQAIDNLIILERVPGEKNISKLTLSDARHKLAKPGSIYLEYDTETTHMRAVKRISDSSSQFPGLSITEPH